MTKSPITSPDSGNAHLIGNFEARVADSLSQRCGVDTASRMVVAVSGGADSVALLAALHSLGYDCVAAHCNFHLRGEESQRDMRHVESIANRLGITLTIKHFDVAGHMAATGESVEMACRSLRYAWFNTVLDREGASCLAVAHHREDQTETFFLNLLRTTGLGGLTGMAWRNGCVVRPMLDMSRAEIVQYLRAKGLDFVTDSSNAENHYRRNRLRNVVIPTIEQSFPGATDAVLATMDHLADTQRLLAYAVERMSRDYVGADCSIDLARMDADLPAPIAESLLFELVRHRGFTATQARNMLMADGHAVFTARDCRAELSRGRLRFSQSTNSAAGPDTWPVSLRRPIIDPVHIDVAQLSVASFRPVRNPMVAYVDAAVLEGDRKGAPEFVLRHWRRGDRMRPYGMKGEKLVSDIFADARLTAEQKRRTWLLTRNGEILWVVGIRASALFAVTPATRRFIRLEYRPDSEK